MVVKVISFYQEGCMGCKEQTPILLEAAADLGIEIEEIDAVKNPEYIPKYNLRVTPTTLVLDGDEIRERMEGLVHREDLEAAIRRHLPEPLPR
ncbi:MAG: thioredoxin family protein [Methanoculleus marisnigri]|uniref:thioredoxin family protein n=1 Tax=Methanoculleus sp. MH98A TaxID=1495314 RepID=UPI0004A0FD11|nr:thioredoxin family protein [Methanoculleus sp. MH98A]KDE55664.1 glutaredoxin [Methanoculleus sp. MH98A]MCC7556975.1 thioredoxin family protein [Methanoculleus marisnigri]